MTDEVKTADPAYQILTQGGANGEKPASAPVPPVQHNPLAAVEAAGVSAADVVTAAATNPAAPSDPVAGEMAELRARIAALEAEVSKLNAPAGSPNNEQAEINRRVLALFDLMGAKAPQ